MILRQFLVWYNGGEQGGGRPPVVVPWQFLVWYNRLPKKGFGMHFQSPFCCEKSENCQLFVRKWLVGLGQLSQKNFNGGILLFRDDQQPGSAIVRQMVIQPEAMLLHGVHSVAYPDINRVLQHGVPVLQKKIAKSGGVMPLFFGLHRQIKQDNHSHKSIHRNGVLLAEAAAKSVRLSDRRQPCGGFAPPAVQRCS